MLEDRLTVTLGARYTEESKDQYIDHPITTAPVTPFSADSNDDWSNFSPAVTLNWAFTDALNVYARYAEGWKSGGYNGESDSLAAFLMAYDPEEVSSYELGLKSRWLDDRLQLNAAVFRNDISDMQLAIFLADAAASSVVTNAGKATVQGFEIEILAQPLDNLQARPEALAVSTRNTADSIDGGFDSSGRRFHTFTRPPMPVPVHGARRGRWRPGRAAGLDLRR